MTNRNCCCKAVLSLSVKPNAVLQVQDRDEPFLNLNTKDKGVDATINGINTLTLKATNGLELLQEGDVATISGLELQNSISSVSSDLSQEVLDRQGADTNLQNQIDVVSGNFSNYRTASDQDAIDNAQNTVINNKQDNLNEQQLSAVNSGITQTLVGQITTNKNDISSETTNRQLADNNLQSQIDAISASSDVTDIVGTYAELQAYDTSKLKDNDIIKVLQDETQNDETTYYRWDKETETFTLIGEEGPYYTKSEADSRFATAAQGAKADTAVQPATLNNYVTTSTTQNITGQKTFLRTETQFQDSIARFVSTYNSSSDGWRGRVVVGAKDYTFILGTYNGMAALAGHKFSNSATESNAEWSNIYIQPDGNKAVYIGGYNWTINSGWLKIQNSSANSGGTVQVNIGTITNANWKNVAYKDENISDFNNDSGYITNAAIFYWGE